MIENPCDQRSVHLHCTYGTKFLAAKAGVEKTYVIDEINRCLHPQVTYRYISEYLDSLENSKTQLIVTTHESHLMDLNLLRRDEIWFVDKNDAGESHLYSLEEYNTRFDQRVRRAYLEGRYGADPYLQNMLSGGDWI